MPAVPVLQVSFLKEVNYKNTMKKIFLSIISLSVMIITGCTTTPGYDYSKLIAKNPRSILVVYPTSDSTDVYGAPAVLANSVMPLTEAGYYVFPVTLVNETFRNNGVTEAHDIQNIPLGKIKEVFNPDAVLYMNVDEYATNYVVLDSITSVKATARLVDADTGELLWGKTAYTSNKGNSGGLLNKLITALFKHIFNNVTDQGFNQSMQTDAVLYSPIAVIEPRLLHGPYSPLYRKDLGK